MPSPHLSTHRKQDLAEVRADIEPEHFGKTKQRDSTRQEEVGREEIIASSCFLVHLDDEIG